MKQEAKTVDETSPLAADSAYMADRVQPPSDVPVLHGTAKLLRLDECGEEAFLRLGATLPALARDLQWLGEDMVTVPQAKGDASIDTLLDDLQVLSTQIHDATLKARLTVVREKLLLIGNAVPQNKEDLSTSDLATQGGLLQPAQNEEESVGFFMRIPQPLSDQFPQKRGTDDSPPHATLLQVGKVTQADFEKILLSARSLLKQIGPFEVQMTDFGEFKNPEGVAIPHMVPRSMGPTSFEEIHKLLRAAMTNAGFNCDHHAGPFKAHATLDYVEPGESFTGSRPEGSFKLEEIEIWGESGGSFGRVVIELGTGDVVRIVQSNKRGADVAPHEIRIISKAEDDEESGDERTVLGIVLEPETIDSQNDIYDADAIRDTAFRFMERYQQFGLMHKQIVPSILPLESYLAPVDFELNGQMVKKGTWILRVRVLDDAIWLSVKSGELTGFSIGGSAMRTADKVQVAA